MDTREKMRALAERTGRVRDPESDREKIVAALRDRRRRKEATYDAATLAIATAVSFEGIEDLGSDSALQFTELVAQTPVNELLDHPQYSEFANLLALKERFGQNWQDILATANAERANVAGAYIGAKQGEELGQYVGGIADKRLEMDLVRKLNAGDAIDGYSLPADARASLAPPNHRTFDILIHDRDGNLLPSGSVKMTETVRTAQDALADIQQAGGGVLLTNAEAPDVNQGEVHQSDISSRQLKDDADSDLDAWAEPDVEEFGEEFLADSGFLGAAQSARLLLSAARNKWRGARVSEGIDWHEEAFRGGSNFVAMTGANAAEYLLLEGGPAILDIGGFGVGMGIRAGIHRVRNRHRSATTLSAHQELMMARFGKYVV